MGAGFNCMRQRRNGRRGQTTAAKAGHVGMYPGRVWGACTQDTLGREPVRVWAPRLASARPTTACKLAGRLRTGTRVTIRSTASSQEGVGCSASGTGRLSRAQNPRATLLERPSRGPLPLPCRRAPCPSSVPVVVAAASTRPEVRSHRRLSQQATSQGQGAIPTTPKLPSLMSVLCPLPSALVAQNPKPSLLHA